MLQRFDAEPKPADAVRSETTRRRRSIWSWLAALVVVAALGSGALALLGRAGRWGISAVWSADLRETAAVLVFRPGFSTAEKSADTTGKTI